MTAPASCRAAVKPRIERALVQLYPRLMVQADRLARRLGGQDLEASDLCQDGAYAATRFVAGLDQAVVLRWSESALAGALYVVAARSMHGQVIDHIRRAQRRRSALASRCALECPEPGFPRQQAARDALRDLLSETQGSAHTVLMIAVEMGDLDISIIATRSGLSPSQIYRLLNAIAHQGPSLPERLSIA